MIKIVKAKSPLWSEKEVNVIKQLYSVACKRTILDTLPNRSWVAIKQKAQKLGLSRPRENGWSEDATKLLRKLYSTTTKDVLLRTFPNRTWIGIRKKAQKLGILSKRFNDRIPKKTIFKDEELAYLAGFTDGDGTITLLHCKPKKRFSHIQAIFNITNKDVKLLKTVQNIFGYGKIRKTKCKGRYFVYHMRFRYKEAEALLGQLFSLLVRKRKQALIVYSWLRLHRPHCGTERDLDHWEFELLTEIHELNQKGPKFEEEYFVRKLELDSVGFAYLAGIIDSDGSIGLYRHGAVHLILHMQVANKSLALLRSLNISFGGKISGPDENGVYRLQFRTKEIEFLLPKIIPYLIRKKKQAELMVGFRENHLFRRGGPPLRKRRPDWEEQIVETVTRLNRATTERWQ